MREQLTLSPTENNIFFQRINNLQFEKVCRQQNFVRIMVVFIG